jgi:hypothetical protein
MNRQCSSFVPSAHSWPENLLTRRAYYQLPRKQRYTTHKMYELLVAEGYQGSESRVRRYTTGYNHNTAKNRTQDTR